TSEDSIRFPEESAEIFRGRLSEPFHRRVEFGEATLRRDDEHEHRTASYFLDEEGRVLRLEQDAMGGRMSEFRRGRHAGAENRGAHDREGLLGDAVRQFRRDYVSMSDPGIASIDPRTRAPVSVKSTSSAQPRSRITCFPASSGSSPRGRLRVTSSAKTIPSRKNSPWQAYDITLSYNFRIESSS